jgi:hypothetical protein
MELRLKFVRQARSGLARLYENDAGSRLWIPRSVCRRTMKWPAPRATAADGGGVAAATHEVEIEDWWLEQNPWPPQKQKELL